MKRDKLTNEQIIKVYAKKGCNVAATCAALDIQRSTFYKWRESDATLRRQLDDTYQGLIDNVESKLLSAINDGNVTATIFFLKCKARDRGYIERSTTEAETNAFEKLIQSLPDEK